MFETPVRYYRRLRGARALARAEAYRAAHRTNEAAAAFDHAAAADPALVRRALEGAADAYETLGDAERAADRLEQLGRLLPENADVALRLARLRLDDVDGWKRRLALAPDCVEAQDRLAALLTGSARVQHLLALAERAPSDAAAWTRLAEALHTHPPVEARVWKALAKARTGLGDAAGALEAWLKACEAEPDEPAFAEAATRLLKDLRDDPAAIAGWRRLLAIHPDSLPAHHALAVHYRRHANLAAAAPHLRFEAETVGDAKAFSRLAMALEYLGEGLEAEAAWSRVLALDAARLDVVDRLVALRRARGDLAGAVAALQAAAQANPDSPAPLRKLGPLLAEAGEPAAALDARLRLVDLAPEDQDARLQLGLQLYDLGRRTDAAPYLAAAAEAAPQNAKLWRRLAWCRRGEENLGGEIEALQTLLALSPEDDEARARLVEAMIEADRRGEAEPWLAQLAERRGDDARLFGQLARARRELGDEAGAQAAWRRLWTINPADPEANENLGEALADAGHLSAAADRLAAAAPAAAKPAVAWQRVARLRRQTEDRPGEIHALQTLFVEAAVFDLKSHTRLASLLYAEHRLSEAEPHLSAVADARPDATVIRRLAQARQARQDAVGEAAAWRWLLQLAPDDIKARRRLVFLHFAQGEPETAVAALRALGDDGAPALWALAAQAYDQAGDSDNEIDAWRQALRLSAPDAVTSHVIAAHARLADLLISIGEAHGAATHLAFCVDQAPDDTRLRERLAGALLAAGRRAEAAEQLALVAQAQPDRTRPLMRYARTLETVGDNTAAAEAWRRVLTLAPDTPEALAALARL